MFDSLFEFYFDTSWQGHLCLIALPFFVYVTCFAVHLSILDRSGDGDAFMSSGFQHTLRGHGMRDTFADVSLGSLITIRHLNTQGGYLHSHPQNYPTGSGQQQVTLYPHRDENNEWYVVKAPGPDDPPPATDDKGVPLPVDGPHEVEKHWEEPLQYLEHGTEVRLVHRKTDKRLHSHDVRAQSPKQTIKTKHLAMALSMKKAGDLQVTPMTTGSSKLKGETRRIQCLQSGFDHCDQLYDSDIH